MYYQAIIHKEEVIPDLNVLVSRIFGDNKAPCFHAFVLTNNDNVFYFVNDAHIDDTTFSELAVLVKEDGRYYQIESLTMVNEKQALDLILETVCAYNKNVVTHKTKTQLLINNAEIESEAHFTCGCCGNGFRGNVIKQLAFDQDNGYGICTRCEQYY